MRRHLQLICICDLVENAVAAHRLPLSFFGRIWARRQAPAAHLALRRLACMARSAEEKGGYLAAALAITRSIVWCLPTQNTRKYDYDGPQTAVFHYIERRSASETIEVEHQDLDASSRILSIKPYVEHQDVRTRVRLYASWYGTYCTLPPGR